jgi:hypothetical protein
MGVALLEDGLSLMANQDLKRGQALVGGFVGLPVTDNLAQ